MSSPTPDESSSGDPVDGRTTRWDAHREARRRELVTATLRAIRAQGAAVGMDDIAASAGTSKTVFYRHFGDRAGLYRAVAEAVDGRIMGSVTKVLADHATGPQPATPSVTPTEARRLIAAAVEAYLRLVEDDPEVYRFIVAAPLVPVSERASADPADITDVISGRMATLLAEQLVIAGRSEGQATVWARAVVGMVRSVADHWLRSGASSSGTARKELVEDVTALIWGGLSETFL